MKCFLRFLLHLIFFITLSAGAESATAAGNFQAIGGVDGGGGVGVVCGNHVSTLDLFEAKSRGVVLQKVNGDLDENLKFFGAKVSIHFASGPARTDPPEIMLDKINHNIISKFRDIPEGSYLKFFNDATLPVLPADCRFVQLAFYDDDKDILYRDLKYWSKLDARDQAALILHEYVYRRARKFKIASSDETRKLIGQLFSDQPLLPLLAPVWRTKKRLWCSFGWPEKTEAFEFFGIEETQDGQRGVAFYFDAFKSVRLTTRVRAFFPGYSLEQFTGGQFKKSITAKATQEMTSREWRVEFSSDYGSQMSGIKAYPENSEAQEYSAGGCEWDTLTTYEDL